MTQTTKISRNKNLKWVFEKVDGVKVDEGYDVLERKSRLKYQQGIGVGILSFNMLIWPNGSATG